MSVQSKIAPEGAKTANPKVLAFVEEMKATQLSAEQGGNLDGAAHSSTNLDLFAGLDFDGVVVVSPMSAVGEAIQWHPRWARRAGYHKVLSLEVDEVEASGTPVLVFEPTSDDLELMKGGSMEMQTMARDVLSEIGFQTKQKMKVQRGM